MDDWKVISASEIEDLEPPRFGAENSELSYKEYLESVQPLIEEYEKSSSIHLLEYNSFDDVLKNANEQCRLNNFKLSFMGAGCIQVEKRLSGQYKVIDSGYHRMYVAKKYNLKVLVHVVQEEC